MPSHQQPGNEKDKFSHFLFTEPNKSKLPLLAKQRSKSHRPSGHRPGRPGHSGRCRPTGPCRRSWSKSRRGRSKAARVLPPQPDPGCTRLPDIRRTARHLASPESPSRIIRSDYEAFLSERPNRNRKRESQRKPLPGFKPMVYCMMLQVEGERYARTGRRNTE